MRRSEDVSKGPRTALSEMIGNLAVAVYTESPGAGSTQVREYTRISKRGLQLACDVTKSGTEVRADQGERRNGCHRDQRGNQRVLDSSDTRLIVDEI